MVRICWNCRRTLETVRSDESNIEYCIVCGAAASELDVIAAAKTAVEKSHLPGAADRRGEIRHVTRYEVQCLVNDAGEFLEAVTVNISDSGICLNIAAPLVTGQTVGISTTHAVITCSIASVRWVNRLADNSYLAGLACY